MGLMKNYFMYKHNYHTYYNSQVSEVLLFKKEVLVNLRFVLNKYNKLLKSNKANLYDSKKNLINEFLKYQKPYYKKKLAMFKDYIEQQQKEKSQLELLESKSYLVDTNTKPTNQNFTDHEKDNYADLTYIYNNFYYLNTLTALFEKYKGLIQSYLNSRDLDNNIKNIKNQLKEVSYFLKTDKQGNYKNLPFVDICSSYDLRMLKQNKRTRNINRLLSSFGYYSHKKSIYTVDFSVLSKKEIMILAEYNSFIDCLKRFNVFALYDTHKRKSNKTEELRVIRQQKKLNVTRDIVSQISEVTL